MPKRKLKKEEVAKKRIIRQEQISSEVTFEKLLEAIEKNEVGLVKRIIEEEKLDVNSHSKHDNTALHFAAEKNNLELLKLFVDECNGDINAIDKHNWSVLHSAASGIINEKEDWNIIEWMLEKGAKVDVRAANGFTIEDVFLQKDWSYAEKYKEIVANFIKKKEGNDVIEATEKTKLSESQTEMEVEEIEAQIETSSSSHFQQSKK